MCSRPPLPVLPSPNPSAAPLSPPPPPPPPPPPAMPAAAIVPAQQQHQQLLTTRAAIANATSTNGHGHVTIDARQLLSSLQPTGPVNFANIYVRTL